MRCLKRKTSKTGEELIKKTITPKPAFSTSSQLLKNPSSIDAPAPWELKAESYLFMMRPPKQYKGTEQKFHNELPNPKITSFSWVMYVDYAESPVGPYRELLFMPGTFRFDGRQLPSITRIYVSSQASIDNGRRNWGIPKELASFDFEKDKDGVEHITMTVDGKPAAKLAFKHYSFGLPVVSWILPKKMRTLGQVLDGRTFEVAPTANGRMHYAKALQAWSDPELFPTLSTENIIASVKLTNVNMTFPEAKIY